MWPLFGFGLGIPSPPKGVFSGLPLLLVACGLLLLVITPSKTARSPRLSYATAFITCLGAISFISAAVVMLVHIFGFSEIGEKFDARLLYSLRVVTSYGFLLLLLIAITRGANQKELALQAFSNTVISVVVLGILFEVVSRGLGVEALIEVYKGRHNTGGIDSYHFQRLSGFFSYPGDFGAVTVLAFFLIRFTGWSKALKISFCLIFLIALFYSQSRAGLILFASSNAVALISGGINSWRLARISIAFILAVILFRKFIFKLTEKLDYIWRFYEDFGYYLSSSKRIMEYIDLYDSTFPEILFGTNERSLHLFYESEWAGSIARVGIIGSLWLIFLAFLAIVLWLKSIRAYNKKYLFVTSYLICYLCIYSAASAGLSRGKLAVVVLGLMAVLINLFFDKKGLASKGKGIEF